jgi:hypothetical protein
MASQSNVRVEGVWVQRPAARAREGSVVLVRVMFVVLLLLLALGLEGVGVGEVLRAVELRVVRLVGEVVSAAALGLARTGGGKSLGWLRVATILMVFCGEVGEVSSGFVVGDV